MNKGSEKHWENINRWLNLAANIGVVLGLIILIIEVQQNVSLTRVLLETERADSQATFELRVSEPAMAQIWIKSIYFPETLSNAEIRSMDGLLAAATMTFERLLMMQQEGLVKRARVVNHINNSAPFYFGSRFGKNWWTENAIGWQGTELYEIADPIIRSTDEDFLQKYYQRLSMSSAKYNNTEAIPEK